MTVPTVLKHASYRLLLPATLLFAALIRPCVISVGYLLLAFVAALLPTVSPDFPVFRSIRIFSLLSLLYTLGTTTAQIAYQIYEAVTRSDDTYTKMCNHSMDLEIWRMMGFIRFNNLGDTFDAARTILPEICAVVVSVLNVVLVVAFSHQTEPQPLNETRSSVQAVRDTSRLNRSARTTDSRKAAFVFNAVKRFTNFAIILYAAFIGCLQPSLLNFVYFVSFLLVATWWALYKPALKHAFYNGIKAFLMFYSALHFVVIYIFQIHFFQKFVLGDSDNLTTEDTLSARIIGLTRLVTNGCNDWYTFVWMDQPWPAVANPIAILIFFYALVLQYASTKDGSRSYLDEDDEGSSVHDETETPSTAVVNDLDREITSPANSPALSTSQSNSPTTNNNGEARHRHAARLLGPSSAESDDAAAAQSSSMQPSMPLRKITSQVVDRQKISQIFRAPGQQETFAHSSVIATITFVLYHSYSLSLVTMMVWALLYHSIFGLILLIVTCLLWVFTNTRKVAFLCAPVLLTYIEALLIIQYLCSMNLTATELNFNEVLKMLGFIQAASMASAFVTLFIKLLLSLPVFLLLRLSRREKYYESLSEHERTRRSQSYGTFTTSLRNRDRILEEGETPKRKNWAKLLAKYLSRKLATYFIFLVSLVLLLTGTQNAPNLYIIGFFIIWSIEIINLKISFGFFRSVAYLFWLCLILYTSVVIITLYVYQFPGFSEKFQQWTGLSKEWCQDIGLINYSNIGQSGSLFVKLLLPILLFAVTMLQLKFFHDLWWQLTQPVRNGSAAQATNHEAQDRGEGEVAGTSSAIKDNDLTAKLHRFYCDTVELLWRLADIHISAIVLIIVAIFISNNICALHLPVMVVLAVTLCLPTALTDILSLFMCVYLCLVAIFKMIYQLHNIPDWNDFIKNQHSDCNATESFPTWLGVYKNANTWSMLGSTIVAIVALGIQSAVIYRQRHHRDVHGEPEETKSRVFPQFKIEDYDRSFLNSLKFLIDYGFFKFGFEICISLMAISAWVRMDFLAAVQCVWIGIFALNSRAFARWVWPIYVLYMTIVLPVQYALYVGFPEETCFGYPWDHIFGQNATTKNVNFAIWVGLSSHAVHWPAHNLVIDFFVLLFASSQLTVFRREGTTNDSIYNDGVFELKPNNPRHDFMSEQRSIVDYMKIAIFHYGHWFTLMMALIAGIGGTSLFALGYIVITLFLLWQGNNLYVMNTETHNFQKTLKRWKFLLTYTIVTIFCKVALQLIGCVFLQWLYSPSNDPSNSSSNRNSKLCWTRQLFSISCVNSIITSRTTAPPLFPDALNFDNTCPVDLAEAQIGFDVFALGFLLFQLRIFNSWFFQHCMIEFRSEVLLARRGAILKNQLIEKEMREQNQQQERKFDEIRQRTQTIRKRYEEQQEKGGNIFEPKTYGHVSTDESPFIPRGSLIFDDPFPFYDPRGLQQPSIPAKRAGDYYMFEYDPSTDELVQPIESFIPEPTPGATRFDKLDPSQLMFTAAQKDLDLQKTLDAVKKGEKITEDEAKRMQEVVNEEIARAQDEQLEITTAPPPPDSKLMSVYLFVKKVLTNSSDMISAYLNKTSREHRYVAYVLNQEKAKLKDAHGDCLNDTRRKLTELRDTINMSNLQLVSSENDIERMEREAKETWQARSVVGRLLTALGNSVLANTDLLCYFLAILAMAMDGGLINLPLPLMVFFWGTLSNPRPSKVFWITMILYTEFVIVVKFICQFPFLLISPQVSNQQINEPLAIDKSLGIQRKNHFALFDVALLFGLFFHRHMLRKLGLWKDANKTDTFSADNTIDEGPINVESVRLDFTEREDGASPSAQVTRVLEGDDESGSGAEADKELNPLSRFLKQLFSPKFRYIRDLYPIMFGLDVICFLIIAIGYSGFGEGGSGNVIGDIQKSRIPLALVIMLIVMTLMIVIDRGLYLRKWVYGKLAYQLIIVAFMHSWIFFVLPSITRRPASENGVAQALYIVKGLYLLVSAWQIRNGYPQLCIGNLITHAYGLPNMVFFKIFMAVPFLFELRTAIDWTWTDTSMPLFDFFNMENFYSTIYSLKCARTFEANYPAPRGQKKGVVVKYFMGLPMILFIILLVWSPLLAFSLMNQIGDISIPDKVTVSMSIEGFPPIYTMEAQGSELRPINKTEKNTMSDVFSSRYNYNDSQSVTRSRATVSFLKDYTEQDILIVLFRPSSQNRWPISNDSIEALTNQLSNENATLKFQVSLSFYRPYDDKKKEAIVHSKTWNADIPKNKTFREQIINAIKGVGSFSLPSAFPYYMQVPNEGELAVPDPIAASILYDGPPGKNPPNVDSSWFDTLTLDRNGPVWSVSQTHPDPPKPDVYIPSIGQAPYGNASNYLQVTTFVDKAYPSFFAKYLQGGVIAMYISLVVVVGRLIRGVFTNNPLDVMVSEIPNPDHLLKICLDIYLVREAKDFLLEQDLFAKLIFLFRSPATLIKWTRPKIE